MLLPSIPSNAAGDIVMSQQQAYQKGRVVPAPCSLSLQAAGRCGDDAALGEVGKAPQILEVLPAPGPAVWG